MSQLPFHVAGGLFKPAASTPALTLPRPAEAPMAVRSSRRRKLWESPTSSTVR